jgi:hypothetical protein
MLGSGAAGSEPSPWRRWLNVAAVTGAMAPAERGNHHGHDN